MSGKVVITIQGRGEGLDAPLDERFGRAERFLVVDGDSGEVLETIANPAVTASHGAGTGAATLVQQVGATAVISGRFGPKAFDALHALGVQAWTTSGGITAGQALARYRDGELERMELKVYR